MDCTAGDPAGIPPRIRGIAPQVACREHLVVGFTEEASILTITGAARKEVRAPFGMETWMRATPPKTRFEPSLIAPETYLIHDHQGEGVGPVSVALNSLLIRSAEPVIVDTGMAENRDTFSPTCSDSWTLKMCDGYSSATTTSTTPVISMSYSSTARMRPSSLTGS